MAVAEDKGRIVTTIPVASATLPIGTERLLGRILDRCLRAILAITADRMVLYQNAPAKLLTARADLLEVRAGRLSFSDRLLLAKVITHISGRAQTTGRGAIIDSTALALRTSPQTESGVAKKSSYRLLVTPLDSNEPSTSELASIWLVFVSELSSERNIDLEVLSQLYGLTPAESELVANLFSGNTLEESARIQEISINTAKTHLRQVFQKCGVQSQGNLLQLLALGPRAF